MSKKQKIALLPGMDGTGDLFAPIIPFLETEFDITVVRYKEHTTYDDLVDSAIAQLPVETGISLIAESFSGPVAISMLEKDREKYGPSVLCATFTTPPYQKLAKLIKHFPEKMYDIDFINQLVLDMFGINRSTQPKVREAVLAAIKHAGPKILKSRINILCEMDVTGEVEKIQTPMLYIQARQDRIISKSSEQAQMKRFKNIQFAYVDGPHLLLQTKPKECADLIREHVISN